MTTKDDTLAQDKGRRRLYEHMGEEGTGGHNQESGETIRPVTHEEGQVTWNERRVTFQNKTGNNETKHTKQDMISPRCDTYSWLL